MFWVGFFFICVDFFSFWGGLEKVLFYLCCFFFDSVFFVNRLMMILVWMFFYGWLFVVFDMLLLWDEVFDLVFGWGIVLIVWGNMLLLLVEVFVLVCDCGLGVEF